MRDVNNIGFQLVLGRRDWSTQMNVGAVVGDAAGAAVVYDVNRQCATLRPRIRRFPRRAVEPMLTPGDRTTAARDRYGTWYWIDPQDRTRIMARNAGDGVVDVFWDSEPDSKPDDLTGELGAFQPVATSDPEPQPLGGLVITADHRLVVGAQSPDQLLVFDLHAGGPPTRIPWFGRRMARPFVPVDAAARPGGGVYVLDAPDDAAPQVWALDRTLRPEGPPGASPSPPDFQPVGGSADAPSPMSGPLVLPVEDGRPEVLDVLPDDTILVLSVEAESGTSHVRRYHAAGSLLDASAPPTGTPLVAAGHLDLTSLLDPGEDDDVTWADWRAHDIAFVPGSPDPTESARGRLVVVGRDGNQAYALRLSADTDDVEVSVEPEYLPLRRFAGKGLVAATREADLSGAPATGVFYDVGDRWVPLVQQQRPRYESRGVVRSNPFDSAIPKCTWHRLFLDACIPSDAAVHVESRASDRIDQLSNQPWVAQPAVYFRATGAEIPYYDPFAPSSAGRVSAGRGDGPRTAPDSAGAKQAGQGTWEMLFQNVEGRYLEIRLTLEGDERTAPRLHALRVYAPRFSYRDQYLPDVYREEDQDGFVDRFLAITEGTLTALEGRIAAVEALFDVRTVPDAYVDWLGSWFGATFDPVLDVRRKRLFLRHAVTLYNQRGTMAGLARMLMLALDPCVDDALFTPSGIAAAVGRPSDADDRTVRRGGVRIVEQFAARDVPRSILGDATAIDQPAEVRVDQPWRPPDGADALNQRFRTFVKERYDTPRAIRAVWGRSSPDFPSLLPAAGGTDARRQRDEWMLFVRRVIEGPYAAIDAGDVRDAVGDAADAVTQRFRAFLQRRYRTIERLKEQRTLAASTFSKATLPRTLPSGTALRDWMHFVGAVLPIQRAAHRFTVLVPVDPDASLAQQRTRLDVARRIVEREKPAHTAFEVLPYDAAFRIGTVRTGLDTVLGSGRRFAPLLIGDDRLGETTVGAAHPSGVASRRLVGRDATGAPRPL